MNCTSCNKEVTDNYIKFKCPKCGAAMTRCDECRGRGAEYICPNDECGYRGP